MKHAYLWVLLLLSTNFAAAQTVQFYENGRRPPMPREQQGETGFAIYYADYLNGEPTSMGEIYDMNRLSCAHNNHPLGTLLKVTRIDNGASVTVRVNDRGPRAEGCVVLLSKSAAIQMDLLKLGKTRVKVEVVGYSDYTPEAPALASREAKMPQNYDSQLTAKGVTTRTTTSLADNGTRSNANSEVRQPTTYQDQPSMYVRSQAPVTNTAVQRPAQTMTAKSGAAATGQFIIQFGSYRDYDNAARHADTLRRQGASGTVVREINTENGLFYKVTSAAFADKASAQRELEGLRNNQISDGIVVTLR